MGFKKATVLVSLLMVCFVLAAQSAKADTITFLDTTDGTQVTTDNPTANRLFTVANTPACNGTTEVCEVFLTPPTGATHIVAGSGFLTTLLTTYLLSETANTRPGAPHSDGLASLAPGSSAPGLSLNGLPAVVFLFNSDIPGVAGLPETGLAPCPVLQVTGVVGCNAPETGSPQVAGMIQWDNGATDTILLASDLDTAATPEPASLILFGSGLAVAGGFLRRRLTVVTPSVVA